MELGLENLTQKLMKTVHLIQSMIECPLTLSQFQHYCSNCKFVIKMNIFKKLRR